MGAFSLIGGSGSGGPGSNSVKGPSSIFEVAQGVSSAATAILGIKPEHITMTNLSVEGSPSSGHLEELTSSLREDSVIPGKIKGIIPIVYDAKIVEAVTEFKKLRVRRKFMLRDQHDMVDLGILQSDNKESIEELQAKVSLLDRKMDKILDILTGQKHYQMSSTQST